MTLQSPNYPNNYNLGETCVWLFRASPGSSILLETLYFDINVWHTLCIGVFDDDNTMVIHHTWHGMEGMLPANITIDAYHIWIAFTAGSNDYSSYSSTDTNEYSKGGFLFQIRETNTTAPPFCASPNFQCFDDPHVCTTSETTCNGDERQCKDSSDELGIQCRK